MDIVNNLLFFVHMVAIGAGVGGGLVLGLIGPVIAGAEPGQRPPLATLRGKVFKLTKVGLALFWLSGLMLIGLKYGGVSGFSLWFWAKMALVAVLTVNSFVAGSYLKKAENGDMAAAGGLKRIGMINGPVALLIILSAVFAFE